MISQLSSPVSLQGVLTRAIIRPVCHSMAMFKEQFTPSAAIMLALCLGMLPVKAIAQATPLPEESRGQKSRLEHGTPPAQLMRTLPVIAALDADGNGVISAAEIAGAAAALKKLDGNRDGKLTNDELRPRFAGSNRTPSRNSPAIESPGKPAQATRPLPPVPDKIAGIAPREILKLFGAQGKDGATPRTLEGYRRVFGFTDFNKDGRHSKKEYIDGGRYLTRESRSGIFQASDSNKDGFVSEDEYVENRIITDEAKIIFSEMDADDDNRLTAEELMTSRKLKNKKLASEVFGALDANGDGNLNIPEYLRIWGRWARS